MRPIRHFFAHAPLRSRRIIVRGIGVQEVMPPGVINRPRGTGDFLFSYFYDAVWLAGSELPARFPAGSMMIWSPGRFQFYGDKQATFRHTWIHCDGPMVHALLRQSGVAVDTAMHLSDADIVERPLLEMYDELTRQAEPDAMIVRNSLDTMLRQIAREVRARPPGKRQIPAGILAARHLIESAYERALPLAELAKASGLAVSYFCELFREHLGASPHEYLRQHRMHQAAYLLRDRNLLVKHVAQRVGYSDHRSFSTVFRAHFGVSPSEFRVGEPAQTPVE
jgi:AraC family transcriptional regulator, arabinose operon regulatory protein